jgi:uncharacterized protein YciI
MKKTAWLAGFLALSVTINLTLIQRIGATMTDDQDQPDIRYVVIHRPGPSWKPGVDFREQPGVVAHVKHYRQFHEAGRMEIGGPYLDNSGGMMIPVAGESKEAVEEFAAKDPAVKSGLLEFEVKPWLVAMNRHDE